MPCNNDIASTHTAIACSWIEASNNWVDIENQLSSKNPEASIDSALYFRFILNTSRST
jgi:hypothetical protein